MGISIRIFFVEENGSLKRIPLTRYERLLDRDPKERLPQYAGKRVKYVEVAVQYMQRKPVEILRVLYLILTFDSEGMVDGAELEKQMRLGLEMMPPIPADRSFKQVVNGQHRFAQKSYDDRYRWAPTPEIKEAIVKAIFWQGQKKRQ